MAPRCCARSTELTSGREIYPNAPESHPKRFWICRECGAYVGCHPGTERPLGTPAGPSLRALRREVHQRLDPLWFSFDLDERRRRRRIVYDYLADRLGTRRRNMHVGHSDAARCVELLKILEDAASVEEIRTRVLAPSSQKEESCSRN